MRLDDDGGKAKGGRAKEGINGVEWLVGGRDRKRVSECDCERRPGPAARVC